MKKNRIKRKCNFFSVDFNPTDPNNILEINEYLMKRTQYKKNVWVNLLNY